jgi:hypothetical protein
MQAREAITRWNQKQRAHGKRCGARRKYDGEPCERYAMENGRCHFHGGVVQKGADWHRPRWPKKSSPVAEQKLHAKLKKFEKAARKRERRIASMTAEERASYRRWHQDRQIGTPQQRQARRLEREQAEDARRTFADLKAKSERPSTDPELLAIQARIAELKAELAARRALPDELDVADEPAKDELPRTGVFG